MWRTASPLVPGLSRAPHHHTHTTEASASGERQRAIGSTASERRAYLREYPATGQHRHICSH
jgi:hypothetical protein